jgi:plasmid segregation protein ParM
VIVAVDGQRRAATVEPTRFEGWQRSLHADYAATPAYRALVKAALVLADHRFVERLVTGLPVEQARDPERREARESATSAGTAAVPSGPGILAGPISSTPPPPLSTRTCPSLPNAAT